MDDLQLELGDWPTEEYEALGPAREKVEATLVDHLEYRATAIGDGQGMVTVERIDG